MKINIKKIAIFLVAFVGVLLLILVSAAPKKNAIIQPINEVKPMFSPRADTGNSFVHPQGVYSLIIPPELESGGYDEENDDLFLREKGISGPEYGTDAVVSIGIGVDKNPGNFPIREFYNGEQYEDYFESSSDEYKKITINGKDAYKFVPYQALSCAVIVVIPLDKFFVVVDDSGCAFQENGVFQKVLDSLKFL